MSFPSKRFSNFRSRTFMAIACSSPHCPPRNASINGYTLTLASFVLKLPLRNQESWALMP